MSPSSRCLFSYNFLGNLNQSAMLLLTLVLMIICPVVFADCRNSPVYTQDCEEWLLRLDGVRPRGTRVHGHLKTPSHNAVQGVVHGSRVFGGPSDGEQTVGGGINYKHPSGLHGGVDATHVRGQGNSYAATVGGSTKVGPGTLTIDGGASTVPGSSKVQGQVGATYTIPLD